MRFPFLLLALTCGGVVCSDPDGPSDLPDLVATLVATPYQVHPGGTAEIQCSVTGAQPDELTFDWSASGGSLEGSGEVIHWGAPIDTGLYLITCRVGDQEGRSDSAGVVIAVIPVDSTLGTWITGAPLPAAQQEMATAELDGKIYVIGGMNAEGEVLDLVQVYDPGTNHWSSVSPLPEPRHHHAAAACMGKLYVFGGLGGDYEEDIIPLASVFMYDPDEDSWTRRKPMLSGRYAHVAVAIGRTIHLLGGEVESWVSITNHEVYDAATDGWSQLSPLPTARNHLGAAVIDSVIYAVGGRRSEASGHSGTTYNLGDLEAYDLRSRMWSTLSPMPTVRAGMAVAALSGKLYTMGGEVIDIFRGI
ncbi:MAG: hypothetical protein JSU61_11130, partial [Fidelibacterota bacterium]